MATKIVIDAGHGGYDPGAVYASRKEKDDNLRLALLTGEKLKKLGYDVIYTRTEDIYQKPYAKAKIGNDSGADYFISFHRNSSANPNTANGVQTLIYNKKGTKLKMAENINSELAKLGFKNINVAERPDLIVLNSTRMPAILIEAGFINNDIDNKLFDDKINEMADAIADAIKYTLEGNMASKNMTEAFSKFYPTDSTYDYDEDEGFYIIVGCYPFLNVARYDMDKLKKQGFESVIDEIDGVFFLKAGSFNDINDAEDAEKQLISLGYGTIITR